MAVASSTSVHEMVREVVVVDGEGLVDKRSERKKEYQIQTKNTSSTVINDRSTQEQA